MSFGDILYIIAIVLFSYITFGIIRGNFRSKFDDDGKRLDMKENTESDKEV